MSQQGTAKVVRLVHMSCYVLAGRVRYTTPELAERYGVDNRTILRDIDALRAAGALIAKDDAGRWRMTKRPDWPGVELTALDRAALEA